MSLLSEKFADLEADYQKNVAALRDAAGLCAEAEATAEALEAAEVGLIVSPAVTVCDGVVVVRLLCWSPMRAAKLAIKKAGLEIVCFGEGSLCGDPCDTIILRGISMPLLVERRAIGEAA